MNNTFMKFKFSIATILVLTSAMYCRAGLFDKIDSVLNTAKVIANVTNAPVQQPAAKQPAQNDQVANAKAAESKSVELPQTPPPVAAVVVPNTNSVEPKSEQAANPQPSSVKAYKTLNFGDSNETVKQKLAEIFNIAAIHDGDDDGNRRDPETFWKALFDTDTEYEPYKFNAINYAIHEEQSGKCKSLMDYFDFNVGFDVISGENDLISVNCFQLRDGKPPGKGVLAVVEVSYLTFDLDKLVAGFVQNYPNARKEKKHFKEELLPMYRGAFVEYDKTLFLDINEDRRATLSIDAGKPTITFTEQCELSEPVKNMLLKKEFKPNAPQAVFTFKKTIDFHMNNFRQSMVAADKAKDEAEKARLKKISETSSGF